MLYRQGDADALPWQTPDLDEDIAEALTRAAPPPASVLDVGTGLGTLAAACARRGHRVVATDISAVALEQARALAPDAPVAWLEDDITASKLHGVFDIVLDRGCLHLLLSEDERSRYAASVARRTAPGGVLIVKTLAGPDAELRGTTAYTARELERLLGDAFTLESDSESTLPGPFDAPDARLFVFRRTDD
jgi:2-polyprenyl-3-methyl-5-hydroxy-6-metoxy-1,4-benzoquinol methylase